ncbi:MAG TPA: recombinase family protein [Pirellulales bacterium]
MPSPTPVRCAIDCRRSRATSEDLSSCDAQFEACSSFIKAKARRGWIFDGRRYEDGGSSGEKLDRPSLNQHFEDLDAGRFDQLVVHRSDGLSDGLALQCTACATPPPRPGNALCRRSTHSSWIC